MFHFSETYLFRIRKKLLNSYLTIDFCNGQTDVFLRSFYKISAVFKRITAIDFLFEILIKIKIYAVTILLQFIFVSP